MKKKGEILNNILVVLIVIIAVIFIVAVFSLASIILPIITGEGIESARIIQSSIASAGNSGLTNASNVATETTVSVLGNVELLVYFFFLGLILGYMMIAYYVRSYPYLAFLWIGFMILVVIISMFMSNAYELARNDSQVQDYYSTWGTNDFLMSYLPIIMTVIMIIGGILLFGIISTSDTESKGGMI